MNMKKILIITALALLWAGTAKAESCAAALMPTFTSAQAQELCDTFPISSSATASLLPDDDNTLDLGAALFNWRSIYVGTSILGESDLVLTASADDVIVTATDDVVIQTEGAGDIITLAGGGTTVGVTVSDTAVTLAAGMTGGLAGADDLALTASTDDVVITATDDVTIQTQGAGDLITLAAGGTGADVTIAEGTVTLAASTALTLTSGALTLTSGDAVLTSGDITLTSGAINIPDGASIGAVVQNGANTACDTTCTSKGCFIGYDAGTSAFVACSSALADSCMCAGAAS